jgi:hypothetical protein
VTTSTNTASGGVGFVGLLQLLFIGLKLGGVIDWSWFWVLAPFWGTALFILLCLFVYVTAVIMDNRQRRRRRGY